MLQSETEKVSHNDKIGIQLNTNSMSGGGDVLEKNTFVGDNKVSKEYEYVHEAILRQTQTAEKSP